MNSVVQVLKTIPEFKTGLVPSSSSSSSAPRGAQFGFGNTSDATFVTSLRNFLTQMDNTTDTVTPFQFVNTLRQRFPQFGQTTGNPPSYQQQDAEECLREMFSVIGNATAREEGGGNIVDDLFGFKMNSRYMPVSLFCSVARGTRSGHRTWTSSSTSF